MWSACQDEFEFLQVDVSTDAFSSRKLLKLLKLNLPEFFKTFNNPHILTSCNNEIPAFVFIKGKIARRKGKENIYLPAKNIKIAPKAEEIIIKFLVIFEICLLDDCANQLRKKYTITKIIITKIK